MKLFIFREWDLVDRFFITMRLTQKFINEIAYRVVGCAINVHKEIGPGLLESIYEDCFVIECQIEGLNIEKQKEIRICYKDQIIERKFRLDVLVEDLIIVELKAVESLNKIHQAKLISHLNITRKPKGLLINFNCLNIVNEGLVPLVNEIFRKYPLD